MTVKARFDGKVFVPEGPVDLPVGQAVRVEIEAETITSGPPDFAALLEKLAAFPVNENWPTDGAAQHDHYLYGTPKRT